MLETPCLSPLLAAFHQRKPLRVWSLIVSVYGDAVLHRGGSLWLGSLLGILEPCGIEPGVVRTAMSRLAADGLLIRNRVGRNSYYRLSNDGEGLFSEASSRIYHPAYPEDVSSWIVMVLPDDTQRRAALRKPLEKAGAGALGPSVMVLADPVSDTVSGLIKTLPDDVIIWQQARTCDLNHLARTAWTLDPLADAYRQFSILYQPVYDALKAGAPLLPLEALILRVLLIHDFRRLVLRDPLLPKVMLPDDWPGFAAHALVAKLYGDVAGLGEHWLETDALCETGRLPKASQPIERRFSRHL